MNLFLLCFCAVLAVTVNGSPSSIKKVRYETVIPDAKSMDFDELLRKATENPGLEFLKHEEQMAAMGINVRDIDADIIQDAFLKVPELIQKYGYPCEVHNVQTSDGYILEMHRIPGSSLYPPHYGKRVAFLQHGLLDSSATYVVMGPRQGLAYLLANMGYDVWLGNARGNRYSRYHISNDPDGWRGDRSAFWAFSWHEIGTIDLPTMIDYVRQHTGEEKIHYVGHSQGTTSFFVMCSEKPQYNERIKSAHMLAPIGFMNNLKSPFVRAAALFLNTLDDATSFLGIYELMQNSDLLGLFGQLACNDEAWFQPVCSNILFLIAGFNSPQLNTTMIPVVLGHTPAGASTRQVIHYGQGIRSGEFRQYDFGWVANMIVYGTLSPPDYNLGYIRAPTAFYYSLNDWLADTGDVEKLYSGLANPIGLYLNEDKNFNHLDYTWAIDARELVYNKVLEVMEQYN